jgi:heptosyltransferase I
LNNNDLKPANLPKVAILRLSALGDVVLCAAMVSYLAKTGKFRVFWITTIQAKEMFGFIEGVEFIIIPKPKGITSFIQCRQILGKQNFDFLLLAQASLSAHLVSINVRAETKIGFDSSRSKDFHKLFINKCIREKEEHFVDAYFSFLHELDITKPDEVSWQGLFGKPPLPLPQEWPHNEPFMAVTTSASKIERNWLLQSYSEVIHHIQCSGLKVVLIGGSETGEKDFNRKLLNHCKIPPLDLTGTIKLSELPYFLEKASFLLSPDTGTVHLARAVNTPVVGLYAVANPLLTGPYLALDYSINKHGEALKKFRGESKKSIHSRIHQPEAMELITVDEVIAQVERVLEFLSFPVSRNQS